MQILWYSYFTNLIFAYKKRVKIFVHNVWDLTRLSALLLQRNRRRYERQKKNINEVRREIEVKESIMETTENSVVKCTIFVHERGRTLEKNRFAYHGRKIRGWPVAKLRRTYTPAWKSSHYSKQIWRTWHLRSSNLLEEFGREILRQLFVILNTVTTIQKSVNSNEAFSVSVNRVV